MFSFEVLRAEGFSFSVDILHKEKYVAIFARKYAFFAFVKFTTFGHQSPGTGSSSALTKYRRTRILFETSADPQQCNLRSPVWSFKIMLRVDILPFISKKVTPYNIVESFRPSGRTETK
jgi:hypothetical protein